MSQNDMVIADAPGATVRADINAALQALASTGKGNARPPTVYAGQLWLDDNTPSSTVWSLYLYDGTDDILLGHIDSTNNAFSVATAQAQNVASAATLDLDAAYGMAVDVTGTTTVTAVTLAQGRVKVVRFTGALTLTHGSSLVLPGGVNVTTAAGDYAVLVGYASGVVRCAAFQRATGAAVGTQLAVTSAAFSKTSDTTLADVTGLSANVAAGGTYLFTADLVVNNNGGGGGTKVAIGGTATATSVSYSGCSKSDTPATVIATATALGTAVAGHSDGTFRHITVQGRIVVNAAGTLTVQSAQNTSNANASTVVVGSSFRVERVA